MRQTSSNPQPQSTEPILPLPDLLRLKTLCYPLILIAFLGGAVGETRLADLCHVSRATTRRWLVELVRLGYLERQGRFQGYVLAPQARTALMRLPHIGLSEASVEEPARSEEDHDLPNEDQIRPDNGQVRSDDGLKPTFEGRNSTIAVPTTTESLHINKYESLKAVASAVGQNPLNDGLKIPIPGKAIPQADEKIPLDPQVLDALRRCGIGNPKRSALASMPFITPEYIQAWKSHLQKQRKLTTGLLIHCLQAGDPPPQAEPEVLSSFDQLRQGLTSGSVLVDNLRRYDADHPHGILR